MSMYVNRFAEQAEERFRESENKRKRKYKENIELRRDTVRSMLIRGNSQWEIAEYLGMSQPTVSRDIRLLKAMAKKELKISLEKKFPEEYNKYLFSIDEVLRNAWDIVRSGDVDKTRLDALNFVVECSKRRMDAVINPPVLTKSGKLAKQFLGNKDTAKIVIKSSNNSSTIKQKRINKKPNPEIINES